MKTIDEIGKLDDQIEALAEKREALAEKVKAKGAGSYVGSRYQAVVVEYDRETLDMMAVRRKLSPQFISRNTRTTPCVSLRIEKL